MKRIVLLGLKGVGKTTFGKKLSALLQRPFFDSDREIESLFFQETELSYPCAKIYQERGHIYFRALEHEVLKRFQRAPEEAIIALGGGTYMDENNRSFIENLGHLVILHVDKETLLKRWTKWPAVCPDRFSFDAYFDERYQKLQSYPGYWIHG